LAADRPEGSHPMRRALNRRNPGITEEVGTVAEWQYLENGPIVGFSEWTVNWQVSNPVQV